MKKIMIIAIVGGISFITGYRIGKKRTENRLEAVLDEMCNALDRSNDLLQERIDYLDEVAKMEDNLDDEEDFCYDE